MVMSLQQGSTASPDPLGAESPAPASQWTAGGSPLHFMLVPVHCVLGCAITGTGVPQHQDLVGGLPPNF